MLTDKERAQILISGKCNDLSEVIFYSKDVAKAYLNALAEVERLYETVIESLEIFQNFSDDVKAAFPEYTDRDREKYFPSLARAKKIRLAFGDLHEPD